MNKLLRNESGYSIVLVFFIVILVSVLGLTLMTMNTQSLSLSTHEREDQSIFYIAEAGLTHEKEKINKLIRTAYIETSIDHKNTKKEHRKTDKEYKEDYELKITDALTTYYPKFFSGFEPQYSQQPEAKISATIDKSRSYPLTDTLTIDITSTGYFTENKSNTRSVSQLITVSMNLPFLENIEDDGSGNSEVSFSKIAVRAENGIELKGGSTIFGDAVTSGGEINYKKNSIKGSTSTNYPSLSEINFVPFPHELMNKLEGLPPFSDDNSDDTIKLTNDARLIDTLPKYIDIGNKTINLYVDSLNISGDIIIKEKGKLNIFVKNNFNIKGSINKDGDPNNLNIYHAGNNVRFNSGSSFGGSYFGINSNITINGGATIGGNITTGGQDVKILGDSNNKGYYIIAPNANVKMNANFNGVIICDSFTGQGQSQINYAPGIVPPPIEIESNPNYDVPEDLFKEEDLIEI